MNNKNHFSRTITVTQAQKDFAKNKAMIRGISDVHILGIKAVSDLCDQYTAGIQADYSRGRIIIGGTTYVVRVTSRNSDELQPYYGNVLPTKTRVDPSEKILFLSFNPRSNNITVAGEIDSTKYFSVAKKYSYLMPPMNNTGHKVELFGKDVYECTMSDLQAFDPSAFSVSNKKNGSNSRSRSNTVSNGRSA